MGKILNVEIKNIIVPFDFSEASSNALNHAFHLSKKCGANINILCTMDHHSVVKLNLKHSNFLEFKAKASEKIMALINNTLTNPKLECHYSRLKWSNALAELNEILSHTIAVLGIGCKGQDSFFTSNSVNKLVDTTHLPFIIIKHLQPFNDYNVIMAPLDETMHTREKLPYVTYFAKEFGAKVSLVGLQTHHDKETQHHMRSIMIQANNFLVQNVDNFHCLLISTKQEVLDVLKTADDNKANLIIIMNSHEKSLNNLFSAPYSQQIIDKSHIPVLVCPIRVSMVMGAVSI